MRESIDDRLIAPSPAALWLFGSCALLLALIAYCELCSLVHGEPTVGARISAVWALQAGGGWIGVGAAFALFGDRVAGSQFGRKRACALAALVVIGGAAGAVLTEAWIAYALEGAPLTGASDSIAALIYSRTPISLLASALLTGAWIANRRRVRATTAPSAPEHATSVPPVVNPARGCADVLDVLTGSGHATIRIDDIESFRADRNYITVAHVSGRRYLLRQTMTSLEQSLDPARFERVHRSTIVNRSLIVERRRHGVLVLKSGDTVHSSRSRRRRN